ncbi:MAG: hypothetical protein A2902_03705 [Elusimicrobia bacterium RIFCSPLOWO2_01_FULL_64_13]|nr:MAG: hypothetical protein A2902_03705 [Elusimicrobia bacterium RIFCSPLOWO2_01_FULL_64_13]
MFFSPPGQLARQDHAASPVEPGLVHEVVEVPNGEVGRPLPRREFREWKKGQFAPSAGQVLQLHKPDLEGLSFRHEESDRAQDAFAAVLKAGVAGAVAAFERGGAFPSRSSVPPRFPGAAVAEIHRAPRRLELLVVVRVPAGHPARAGIVEKTVAGPLVREDEAIPAVGKIIDPRAGGVRAAADEFGSVG